MDDSEILAELQHHGGKTNLIDFTTDYLVALFFACDGNRDKPGRVILLKNEPDESNDYTVKRAPKTYSSRWGGRKAPSFKLPRALLIQTLSCAIPADLKGAMLDYLKKHHDISTRTILQRSSGIH